MKRELTFLRHGQTDHNKESLFMGAGRADPPLNAEGIREVRDAAQQLKKERFDLLVYGGKKRVRQTAELLMEEISVPIMKLDDRIGEMDFGVFEGLIADEIAARYPREWKDYLANWTDFTFPEGGNTYAFFLSCAEFAYGLLHNHPQKNILVVAHKGFILCSYTALLHQDPGTVFDNDIKTGGILRVAVQTG